MIWYFGCQNMPDKYRPSSLMFAGAVSAGKTSKLPEPVSASCLVPSRPEARKQRRGVATVYGVALSIRHRRLSQLLDFRRNFHEWVIGPEQDIAGRGDYS